MSEINVESLHAATRRAQDEKALEIIDTLPEKLRAAAQNAEAWTVVVPFFVVPGLLYLSFDGKQGDLTGVPKLVSDYLQDQGLNPGFVRQEHTGTLPDGSKIEGILYRVIARWDTAAPDNLLRQLYEEAVLAQAGEITGRIPQLIQEASAAGEWWAPIHKFFTSANLPDRGFDGNPENLTGVALRVYAYLAARNLNPFFFYTEGRGVVGGCPWGGVNYFIAAQWYGVRPKSYPRHPAPAQVES